MKERKNNKGLIVGIVAAVVVLAAVLALVLTQCAGNGTGEATNAPTNMVEEVPSYEIYMNLDRELYDGKSEAGMSSRQPEADGLFHIRFKLDGEEVTLRTAERKVVNKLDTMDLMGLVFDEDGLIVDALALKEMPLEITGNLFFVQSTGGNVIKLNSSDAFDGMVLMLETTEKTGIWDMSGVSGPKGVASEPVIYDRVICIENLAGELTHVFIAERTNYFLTHEAECLHCKETVTWYEWTKVDDFPSRSGHYQMMTDLQLTGAANLKANVKMCVDLNGYKVHAAKDSRVVSLQSPGSEFVMMDTSAEKKGALVGHGNPGQGGVLWVRNGNAYMYGGTLDGSDVVGTNGAVVMINSKRYFYLHDGTIIGGIAKAQTSTTTNSGWAYGAGGAVYLRGTMRMYGGTITGGRAEAGHEYKKGTLKVQRGYGGNIFMGSGAVFELQDGQILNGYAGNMGGNIFADGTAEIIISGGVISGGSSNAKTKSGHGGNIYTGRKVLLTMTGGTVKNGKTYKTCAGGNMAIHGTMILRGGLITDGWAGFGGNLHVGGSGKVNMYGGTISGGTALKYGGNLNVSGTSVMTVSNGRIINGTAETNGGNINGNKEGTFNLKGGVISGGYCVGEKAGNGGGNISVISADFNIHISGGTISGGKTEGLVNADGTTAGGDGGNINLNRGTLVVSGGTITGGMATGNGGGIYVGAHSEGMTLKGEALIYGNGLDLARGTGVSKGHITLDGWKGNGENGPLVIDRLKGQAGSVLMIPVESGALTEADLELFADTRRFLELAVNSKGQIIFGEQVVMGESDHTHCLCADGYEGHSCADTGFVSVDAKLFGECWTKKDGAYNALGDLSLCLTEDMTLNAPYFTYGKTVNLCLHGHTITLADGGRLTSNGTTGVLNITDCVGTGTIKADASCTGNMMTTYKGALNIYGGTIDGSAIKRDLAATSNVGAVLYLRDLMDTFHMYGGKLIGGQCYRGGAVYVYKGQMVMYGGEISGGTAAIGGNVAVSYGSLTMRGGKIYGGTATEYGSGVHIGANAGEKATILSGSATIFGNAGADVYLGSATAAQNYLVLDNWNGNGGKELVLECRGVGIGSVVAVAAEGQLTESDVADLVYVDEQKQLKLRGGVGVLELYTNHRHCICADKAEGLGDHSCEEMSFVEVATAEAFKALFDAENKLLENASIALTGDFALDSRYYTDGKTLTLCLGGHTITLNGTADLLANNGGALNITDCGDNGKLLCGEGRSTALIGVNNGAFKLFGGTLDASSLNDAAAIGGAVILRADNDAFTMYGGQLIGAEMVERGAAVYMLRNGNVVMHGGKIVGGNAKYGGAVCINKGVMEMTGGEITGGNATEAGGGVSVLAGAGSFTISGAAQIYDNMVKGQPNDVYMGKTGLSLMLDNWAGNGEQNALVFTSRDAAEGSVVVTAREGQLTEDVLTKLTYGNSSFLLMLQEGKVVLTTPHGHCLCNDALDAGCDHEEVVFTEVSDAESFLAAILAEGSDTVNLVLGDSFAITESRYIDGKTVNLCLNGKTLTMNNAKLIARNGATLNVTTCNGGEIKAGTKTSRQMLYAYTGGGVVNLYAGTINASIIEDSTGLGAAVQIKSDSTQEPGSAFNMYGGHIIGAKSIKRGTVYVESGRFNMYGGKITDGHAKEYGGAVCIKAGHAQIAGGEITGCTAGISGAAIAMMVDADSLTISGNAQIHGNTCADKAEDVYLGNKNKSAFYVILDNWAGNENGEKLHITAHKDKVDGSIIAKAKTGSLTDAACAMLASYDVAYTLKLENGNVVYHQHNHCICNDTLDTGCDHEAVVFTEVSDAESFLAAVLAEGSDTVNLALTDSFALTEAHYIDGKTVNLCLNGQIITMNNAKLIATNGGVLNVTTCNGGEIKAGTKTSRQMLYAHTGGGIVNLYGGTINASAIESTDVGAAVQVKNDSTQEPISTFNMYGGHIIGAKSIKRGTVFVDSGRFNMYGGKITDGHSSDYGGAVCINTGHVQIAGGEITGCTAAKGGAAIAMLNNADSLTISGNAQIHGNTCADKAEDVYLGNKGKSAFYVILDNWAGNENGEKLHISTHKDKVDGGVIAKAKTGSLTDAACAMLASYDKNYMLKLENGQVVYHRLHEHCLCNGTLKEQSGHTCKALRFTEVATAEAFKALFDSNNKLKADCNMVLTADITLDAVYESGGHSWNLCLNGNSITLEDGAYLSKDCNVMNCALSGAVTKKVDLVMFMGQSNMAGRGVASESEVVPEGHGYEFRAISDPTKLYPIAEPFGVKENNSASGVTENSKTGSMVSAFVKNYYEQSQRTIVAVSCSKGSTGLDFWKVDGNALNDAIARHEAASNWLHANGYTVENDFMVWCQGETDGGDGMSAEDYATGLKGIIEEMIAETGIEFCAVVRIGNAKNDPARHSQIIKAQTQLCKTYDKAVLVSAKLAGYGADMMKDDYHYTQAVYNTVGMDAGINTASYIRTGIEPSMYDPQYDNQYPRDEIPEQPSVNTLEFTFDSATENGIDLSSIGTVANGALTVTEASNKAKNGVNLGDKQFTISPDKSFTIEFVTSGSERVVVLGSGSSKGGFVFFSPVDSPKLRLRFASSSKQFDATTQAVAETAKTHIAIVYDADAKTLSMYQDGVKLTVSGNMSNFGTITFTTLCGGYGNTTDNYYYRGELHYLRFTEQVLTTEQFHKEP